MRDDHYQVPNGADDQAAGIRDLDLERDYIAGLHWTHVLSDGLSFTPFPYNHFNSARYVGGPGDMSFILDDNNRAAYVGVQSVLQAQKRRHNVRAGIEMWGRHSNALFGLTANPGRLLRVSQWRIAYANQIAQGIGPITGGLIEFAPTGNFPLDHDQRNTVSSVLSLTLPGHMYATPVCQFGSGFLNGNGPAHLPPHSTFDLAMGKRFGENWSVSVNAANIANSRYLPDTSNTFGGTHYINPPQVYAEVRYRFHY